MATSVPNASPPVSAFRPAAQCYACPAWAGAGPTFEDPDGWAWVPRQPGGLDEEREDAPTWKGRLAEIWAAGYNTVGGGWAETEDGEITVFLCPTCFIAHEAGGEFYWQGARWSGQSA